MVNNECYIELKSFTVLNRWGETIFSREPFTLQKENTLWDGKINGQRAPLGAYAYSLILIDVSGKPIKKEGVFSLVF